MIEYGKLSPDELVDLLLDEEGLVAFLDTQQRNIPYEDWEWDIITRDLIAFSRGYLTFSPEYLRDLYEMQRDRIAAQAERAA